MIIVLLLYLFQKFFFQQIMLSKEPSLHSSIRLQHALQDYKQQQNNKNILENRLTILKSKCENNNKKNKNAASQLQKIKSVKHAYLKGKYEVEMAQSIETEERSRRIRRDKTLRQQSKENMSIIRNLLSQERKQGYLRMKEQSKLDEFKVTQHLKKSLQQKRQKSLEIKLQEQEGQLSRTIYLQKKRMKTQKQSEVQLVPLQVGTQRTKEYIAQMKAIEQEMTLKLKDSQLDLNTSKMSLRKETK